MADRFAAVDALAEGFQRRGTQPGLAYGIVEAGRLVHAGGFGEQRLGGPVPGAGTVFRIASMTKSFTAAAVRFPDLAYLVEVAAAELVARAIAAGVRAARL